jgi:hypothetical protein
MANQPLDAAFAARQDNRKKSSRRFIVLGALFVGLAGTAASVYAANININSAEIVFAQGAEEVVSCDTDATTDIESSFSAATGFTVASVTVSGLAAECNGLTMDLYLTDGSAVLGQVTGITIDDTTMTFSEFMNSDESSSVSVSSDAVTDVALEIRG